MLGGQIASWVHKLLAEDRKACRGLLDGSSSCPATMPTQLGRSKMQVAPPGPRFAKLLCLVVINSQDAASLEASL